MKLVSKIKMLFSDERFQLIYGILLIILVPLVIIFNAISTIERYNETINISLQRRGLLMGRVFSSLIKDDLQDQALLQRKVNEISKSSTDILDLQILIPEGSDFKIIASKKPEAIGQVVSFYYYSFAWQQAANEALATDSLLLSSVDEEINPEIFNRKQRFWLVSMPLLDNEKNKVALLSMTLSSQVVDNLSDYTWQASLWSLALTILIIILFLAVSTRLWGYATLYRKIKEVDQMKDEFISMASHELRTPITVIKGYLSMILDGSMGKVADKTKQALEKVMSSSNRLGSLVEDLLDVSRIEQGRIKLEVKPLIITPIIKDVVDELSITAKEENLKLIFEPEAKIPKLFIDPDRLKQILINIIGNAIKYTQKGSVTVSCGVKENMVEVKIKDTGIGMSLEEQKQLFQKFYRVKSDETRKIQGTGLGLWITKQLVELMNGKIYIESMEGSGTLVTLNFPISGSIKK